MTYLTRAHKGGEKSSINSWVYGAVAVLVFMGTGYSAQAQTVSSSRSSGTNQNFSYSVQSTIGTQVSGQQSGNIIVNSTAVLELSPGSMITNGIGGSGNGAGATFIATPSGGNVDLMGITADNLFMIQRAEFNSTLETVANPDPDLTSVGSSSAMAVQTTTVTVNQGVSTFENTLQQAF